MQKHTECAKARVALRARSRDERNRSRRTRRRGPGSGVAAERAADGMAALSYRRALLPRLDFRLLRSHPLFVPDGADGARPAPGQVGGLLCAGPVAPDDGAGRALVRLPRRSLRPAPHHHRDRSHLRLRHAALRGQPQPHAAADLPLAHRNRNRRRVGRRPEPGGRDRAARPARALCRLRAGGSAARRVHRRVPGRLRHAGDRMACDVRALVTAGAAGGGRGLAMASGERRVAAPDGERRRRMADARGVARAAALRSASCCCCSWSSG